MGAFLKTSRNLTFCFLFWLTPGLKFFPNDIRNKNKSRKPLMNKHDNEGQSMHKVINTRTV